MAAYDNDPTIPVGHAAAGALRRRLALVFGIALLACLFGIVTRPLGFLATFWPANAIMLGLFVRRPDYATPAGWGAAALGFLGADFVTGGGIELTLWLTLANFSGIFVGWLLFRRLREEDRRLEQLRSMLYLFAICAAAAAAAAVVGAGIAPAIYGGSLGAGLAFWFATELANHVVTLPVLLAAPRLDRCVFARWAAGLRAMPREPARWAPLAAVALSFAAALLIGGPGAVAFSIPALLWAAVTYSVFCTAVLTMLVCVGQMVAVSAGILPLPALGQFMDTAMSLRLGTTLVAMGALGVVGLNATREAALRRLEYAASHDGLTGALTRAAFLGSGADALARAGTAAVLLLDVDNFKQINDRHGHAAGDRVLAAFASAIAAALRPGDVFGRLGGEEFGVVLPRLPAAEAMAVAERLRADVARLAVPPDETGPAIGITVSIGVAHGMQGGRLAELERLMALADGALYRAKQAGRNKVSRAGAPAPQGAPDGTTA